MKGFNHLTLCIHDLQLSLSFYCNLLGMKLVHSGRSDAYLEWGSAWICLLEKKEHTYQSNVLGMDHIAFTVDESEFNELVAKIRDQNIPIVRQPVWRGGGFSFQCKDPDGIVLEFFTGSLKRRMKNWK